jgi:hypothetical protein
MAAIGRFRLSWLADGPDEARRDRFWAQKVLDAFETRSLDPCPGAASNIKTAINCSVSAVCYNCTNRSKCRFRGRNPTICGGKPGQDAPACPSRGPAEASSSLENCGPRRRAISGPRLTQGALRSTHRSSPQQISLCGISGLPVSFRRFVSRVYWSA